MGFLDPHRPAFNAIIVYIIFILTIYILKPNVIYDHQKNEFKSISYEIKSNPSVLILTVLGIISSIVIYGIFASIDSKYKPIQYIYKRN